MGRKALEKASFLLEKMKNLETLKQKGGYLVG